MKIKYIETDSGNFLATDESETQFGFFDKGWSFIRFSYAHEWEKAKKSWNKKVYNKDLEKSPFPDKPKSDFGSLSKAFERL